MAGVTRSILTWDAFNNYVERNLDNSAYSAAHPDDILVVAGPARLENVNASATNGVGSLLCVGQIQMGSVNSSVPVQPTKALGSARKFFLMDSPMHQITISRLIMNGRNLLRASMHSAVEAGIDVGDRNVIGSPASYTGRTKQQWWTNLDSPVYRIPIGLGFLFRDRAKTHIGGVYAELALIQQWGVQFASGQSAVIEQCSFVCDQVLPWGDSSEIGALASLFDQALLLTSKEGTAAEKARAGATDGA